MAAGLGLLTHPALHKVAVMQNATVTQEKAVDTQEAVDPQETQEEAKTLEVVVLMDPTPEEALILEVLQARGITHPNALATILGNIKQESRFEHNICEGGARVEYQHCHVGGYGLIQWTTAGRYRGLGEHAKRLGLNPSTLEAQISYVFQEREWRLVEHHFKTPGKNVDHYMGPAFRWLGWGVHGARSQYAFDYVKRMRTIEVPVNEHPTSKFTNDHHYLK